MNKTIKTRKPTENDIMMYQVRMRLDGKSFGYEPRFLGKYKRKETK